MNKYETNILCAKITKNDSQLYLVLTFSFPESIFDK